MNGKQTKEPLHLSVFELTKVYITVFLVPLIFPSQI